MSVTAKCHNYTGCLQAFRGEKITLAEGAPLVCPECGKPVTVETAGSKLKKLVPAGLVLLVLVLGALFGWPLLMRKGSARGEATPAPSTPVVRAEPTPPGSVPLLVPTPVPTPAPEPPTQPVMPKKIQTSVDRPEVKIIRDAVLERIDKIPNLSAGNKDKLINSVLRARSMGLVLTVPFGSGRANLSASEVGNLKSALENAEIMKFRDDPTAVFVVLGYADPKGDEKTNLRVSQERADATVATMRTKCGVGNVTHSVGMGGSTLHGAKELEKNRIVEIWVVLP